MEIRDIRPIGRYHENVMKRISAAKYLTDIEKRMFLDFEKSLSADRKKSTVYNSMKILNTISKENPEMDFSNLKKKDIKNIIDYINKKQLSQFSKYRYGLILRQFLQRNGKSKLAKKIRIDRGRSVKKTVAEMLSSADIIKMILTTDDLMEKAILCALYEGAFRIGELGMIGTAGVTSDGRGVLVDVDGKTGPRRVRLVVSAAYFEKLLELRPKSNENGPMWIKNGKQIMYPAFVDIVKGAAKRAGIDRRVHCHLLRHSGCTHAATELTDAQMRERFGWTPDSQMAGIYVHLSGRDVDKSLLKIHGLDVELGEEKNRFTVIRCDCGKLMPIFEERCVYCGSELVTFK